MPLPLAEAGSEQIIKSIGGNPKTQAHLRNLGFIEGEKIYVVSSFNGNLIVQIKDSRVGIDRELAMKILV